MKFGTIPGVGKPVSRLALGTMIVTVKEIERSFALLDAATESGYNALDTAHGYNSGDSERAIGRWLEARGNREKIVIMTKCCHPNCDRTRVTPFDIAADLHDSLARLKTSYVDLLFLHRDNLALPVGPIVEALNEQVRAGRVRAFGASNWTHQRMQEANDYARSRGLAPFVASSPQYSLAVAQEPPWAGCISARGPAFPGEEEWHARTRTPLFAWSSLARGLFHGTTTRENAAQVLGPAVVKTYCFEENFRRLDRAQELAREKGVSVAQIALAWVLHRPLDIFPLTGAATREECLQNVAALDIVLTRQESEWLDLQRDAR